MLRTTDEYSGHLEGIPRQEFSYGGSERQFCQLFVEFESDRPLPVLVFIHGGCWMNEYPARMTSKLCATFSRKLGIAVWNIEYSMLGDDTGGYPGTFTDVSKAIGLLQNVTSFSLDLSHIVLAGHSAGGQLAAWYVASNAGNSLPIKSVISLAGVHDLARAIELDICGKSIKHVLPLRRNLLLTLSLVGQQQFKFNVSAIPIHLYLASFRTTDLRIRYP